MDAFNSMPPPLPSAAPGDGMGMEVGMVEDLESTMFGDTLLPHMDPDFPMIPFNQPYDFHDFSTGFEDPFSYSSQPFQPQPPLKDPSQDSPSLELDNKLLGFSAPVHHSALVDASGQPVDWSMTAELRGMFFVAEDVFGAENSGRPLELTCYRRNLWQCLGDITIPRNVTHVVAEQGERIPIVELAASISAIESIDQKTTEIISIPWKNTSSSQAEDPKTTGAPANCPVDLESGQEDGSSQVTVNISWKRLQFKHATANNGRRKGLQQHYIVNISLVARLENGDWVQVAQISSSPVIVRGRSPRNFDSKKDIPLTGERKPERRSINSDISNFDKGVNALDMRKFHNNEIHESAWATPQPLRDLNDITEQPPAKRLAISPTLTRPAIPAWPPAETPMAQMNATPINNSNSTASVADVQSRPNTSGPIRLSLTDDEKSPNQSSAGLQSPPFPKSASSTKHMTERSPGDDEDMLYEYFPLSVHDLMPPVEAIYRPHVVHHTIMPTETQPHQVRSKMKRYFTAES